MARLYSTKVVNIKAPRKCYGIHCYKTFPKGTKMLSQKYFPDDSSNKCSYRDILNPITIHVCRECVASPEHQNLMDNHK